VPVVHFAGSQVDFDALRVLFGAAPPVIPEDGAYRLWVNEVEVTGVSEWSATWSEVVGGVGQATVTVQNRASDPSLDFNDRDILRMTMGTWVLFEGEVVRASIDLPAGYPFRRWVLSCSDWNTIPDTRMVNVPDGQNWAAPAGGDGDLSSSDTGGPQPVDPESQVAGTDRATIQNWYQYKVLAPDGGAFDTDEFVDELIPNTQLIDGRTGEPNFVPGQGPLKGAISQMGGLAAVTVYDWIDPDRKVHHQAFDGDYLALAPVAPAVITDQRAEWDGTTKIGGRGLHIDADMTYAPQVAYVNGVTGFVMLAAADPASSGGRVLYQGSGWGHSTASSVPFTRSQRQIMVDGQSVTRAQRDALADTYTAFGSRPRYTGSVTIGGRDDEGNALPLSTGWRAGQVVTITDERLPAYLDNTGWPIQRLSGSLRTGDATVMILTLEFGDMPIGRFSEKYADHTKSAVTGAEPKPPAPRHAIYWETLNPKPGEAQTLKSQAVDNSEEPIKVKGVPVHWEFVSVKDFATDDDRSGNGESLSPNDTFTDADGIAITTFTAGTLSGVAYQIEASTEYQDL